MTTLNQWIIWLHRPCFDGSQLKMSTVDCDVTMWEWKLFFGKCCVEVQRRWTCWYTLLQGTVVDYRQMVQRYIGEFYVERYLLVETVLRLQGTSLWEGCEIWKFERLFLCTQSLIAKSSNFCILEKAPIYWYFIIADF